MPAFIREKYVIAVPKSTSIATINSNFDFQQSFLTNHLKNSAPDDALSAWFVSNPNKNYHIFYHPRLKRDSCWKSLFVRYRQRCRAKRYDAARTLVQMRRARTSTSKVKIPRRSASNVSADTGSFGATRKRTSLTFLSLQQSIHRHTGLRKMQKQSKDLFIHSSTTSCKSNFTCSNFNSGEPMQDNQSSRTQKIINDAIECLLWDEHHTRHLIAKEMKLGGGRLSSRSSIPTPFYQQHYDPARTRTMRQLYQQQIHYLNTRYHHSNVIAKIG